MNFKKHQPIYVQIAETIFEDILEQKLTSGAKVPSVRELATTVQVNPNTVQRSFQWLQDENIIEQRRGIGFFITDSALHKTLEIKKKEFFDHILPETIHTIRLLQIPKKQILDEIEKNIAQ